MKIGISQIKEKAPQWLRILRTGPGFLTPLTISYLQVTEIITNPKTLLFISETSGYIIALLIAACIFSGVPIEQLEIHKNEKANVEES